MTRGDNYPAVSETQAAIMLKVVERPLELTIPLMAQDLYSDNVTVFRSVERLDDRRWLVRQQAKGPSSRMPTRRLEPSSTYERSFDDAMEAVDGLPENDQVLFHSAVMQRTQLRAQAPKDERRRDMLQANFLGRTVLLGQRHEVITRGWLRGVPGWQLLAGTAAARNDLFS